MQSTTVYSIGIIGFGAGGLSLFVQLVDRLIQQHKSATIHIFEPCELALGKAYATTSQYHILNLDTHSMSAVHSKVDNFNEWFQNNEAVWRSLYPDVSPDEAFPPRGVFGLYLKAVYKEYLDLAKANTIDVQVHEVLAKDVSKVASTEELTIIGTDGSAATVNAVVLAIGNMPSELYSQFIGRQNYYLDTELSQERTVSLEGRSVGVIGTRLTAIDVTLQLMHEKGTNDVTLLSRTGRMPKIIGSGSEYNLKYLTPEAIQDARSPKGNLRLSDLLVLFKKEVDHAVDAEDGWTQVISHQPTTKEELKEEITLVESGASRAWQAILVEFYPYVPGTWDLLSVDDKKTFLRQIHSVWLTYLAAFPLKNAKRIEGLWSTGKLDVVDGVESIDFDEGRDVYVVHTKKANYEFEVLVNATGVGHNPFKQSPLLSIMEAGGLISPGPLGDIHIDLMTCRAKSDTHDGARIYAIGEITFGDWFATSDLSQISRQAEKVVSDLFTDSKV